MEQISSMKITGITLTNFRNHSKTEHFDFGDLNYITGHNGTGKTTMAHAVCYALYGVSYYGEQKIERLMNENANDVSVRLDFDDQNGTAHTLIRSRANDKNSLLFDGYTISQGGVEQMFGDKNTFISIFNPTYLVENLGNEGRELILKNLKPISQKDVLDAIPAKKSLLESIDLETQSPENALKNARAAIRHTEQQLDVLQGHIESIQDAMKTYEHKLEELYSEKKTTEAQIDALKTKQFENLNLEDIDVQRDVLTRQLSNSSENSAIAEIKEKFAEAKNRVYFSKFTKPIAEAQAEYKNLCQQYNDIVERINGLKIGDTCPTCMMLVTENNFNEFKTHLTAEANRIGELGRSVVARGKEIAELDKKAKETFEKFQTDDIAKYTLELEKLSNNDEQIDITQIRAKLDKLTDLEKYGNLTEAEFNKLNELNATLIGINAQIKTIEETASNERLKSALVEKDSFNQQLINYKTLVSALSEYIFKRAELATANISMPNVKLKLFDVIRSTGEIKNAFKFEYKGREYTSLSLSEKALAGIEIAAMMRSITGKDYPLCIDNTESIAAFNNVDMPSQVMLIRVVKGQPLTVKFQNNASVAYTNEPLRKAA